MNKDFDIDSILDQDDLFKPLSDGLGFHHSVKEKKDVAISLKKQSLDLKRDLDLRTRQLNKRERIQSEDVDMGELAPFYKNKETSTFKEININLDKNYESELETAPMIKRFSAYMLDISLLFVTMVSAFIGSIYASNLTINDASSILSDNLSAALLLAIGALFYSLYFSFFDRSEFSTIGKRILGLKLVSSSGKLSFYQTLFRSTLSIVSLFTLGLFNILKLEDKLTDSTVICDE